MEDEEAEGVWGYLIPLDSKLGETLVLRKRPACPAPFPHSDFGKGTTSRGKEKVPEQSYGGEEESYEQNKLTMGWPAGGYLIGRHIECGRLERICLPGCQELTLRRSCAEPTHYIKSSLPPIF